MKLLVDRRGRCRPAGCAGLLCVLAFLAQGHAADLASFNQWRAQYFGPDYQTNPDAAPTADPDRDGFTDFQEYLAGTNPTYADSHPTAVPLALSTFAGSIYGTNDGYRTDAKFNAMIPDLVMRPSGDLWVLESNSLGADQPGPGPFRIRIIDPTGMVRTYAGSSFGTNDGPLNVARFAGPQGLAFNSKGDAFVCDNLSDRIRKIDSGGNVITFAGSVRGFQNGPGLQAEFNVPMHLTIDAQDNLYVADWYNVQIRKITPDGNVTTYAGGTQGNIDGARLAARFGGPVDVRAAPSGSLYVADWLNNAIRKIDPTGQVTTFASGLSYMETVSVDADENIYAALPSAAAPNELIRFDENGLKQWTLSLPTGYKDGPVSSAQIGHFGRVVTLDSDHLLVADTYRIREITLGPQPLLTIMPDQTQFTNSLAVQLQSPVAGAVIRYTLDSSIPGSGDAIYTQPIVLTNSATVTARLFLGDLAVSDPVEQTFQMIPPPDPLALFNQWRTQYFGPDYQTNPNASPTADPDQDGFSNFQEYLAGTNPLDANSQPPNAPVWLSTFAGSTYGTNDGYRTDAEFNLIPDFSVRPNGEIWVVESNGTGYDQPGPDPYRVRIIDLNGMVHVYAGSSFGTNDGPVAVARFAGPYGMAFDSRGNLFLADHISHRIRRIDPNGIVTTFAGSDRGFQDGPGAQAKFNVPMSLTVDDQDNVFVADWFNVRIRKITPDGNVTTFAGGTQGNVNGPRQAAEFGGPIDVRIGPSGSFYVSDWSNGEIRKIDSSGQVSTFASGLRFVESVSVDSDENVYAALRTELIKFDRNGIRQWDLTLPSGDQDGPVSSAKISRFGRVVRLDANRLLTKDDYRLREITLGAPPLLVISPSQTVFTNSVTVQLQTPATNAIIRYTLDGSTPGPRDAVYSQPIQLNASAVVTARLFLDGLPVSDAAQQSFQILGPAGAVQLAAGAAAGSKGASVLVPITSSAFTYLTAQFSIHWDTSVAQFVDVEQFGLPNLSLANFGTASTNSGTLLLSWDNSSGQGAPAADGATLFAIRFNLIGQNGATSAVSIDGTPTPIEISNDQAQPATVSATAGRLTVTQAVTLSGKVAYYNSGLAVPGVTVTLSGDASLTATTAAGGTYSFQVTPGGNYVVTPSVPNDPAPSRGISTLDIALIRRHILQMALLDSPYKLIAADVRGAKAVSTLDLALIRRVILGMANNYPVGVLWRFVSASETFPDPQNPWSFSSNLVYSGITANQSGQDFVAIKLGDVRNAWTPALDPRLTRTHHRRISASQTGSARVEFALDSVTAQAGGLVRVPVRVSRFVNVTTVQFTVAWDPAVLQFAAISAYGLPGIGGGNFGNNQVNAGRLSFSWDDPDGLGVTAPDGSPIITLDFRAAGAAGAASTLAFIDAPTPEEASENLAPVAFIPHNGSVQISAAANGGSSGTLSPTIGKPLWSGKSFRIPVSTLAGKTYVLEATDSLSSPNWTVIDSQAGTGGAITLQDNAPPVGSSRFYRIRTN